MNSQKFLCIVFVTFVVGTALPVWGQTWFYGLEHCFDGVDNNNDGLLDCQDPACLEGPACRSPVPTMLETPGISQIGLQTSSDQSALVGISSALAATAVASVFVSLASAATGVQSGPELLRSLLPFSTLRRRQTPWGRVIEARSNRPIAGVELSLLDETGKVRATEQSRGDGTFGFFVPPGTYRLVGQRIGYQFPTPAPDAALFPGEIVYDGGWITIIEESIVSLVVIGQELTHSSLDYFFAQLSSLWIQVQIWQARLAWPLLLFGSGLTAMAFWNGPSWFLGGLLGVYGVLCVLELLLSRVARRAIGKVKDAVTNKGLGLAVVRLSDEQGRLVATRVTLPSGQFLLMPAPGAYRVDVIKERYQPYAKERLKVRKYFLGVASVRAKLMPV